MDLLVKVTLLENTLTGLLTADSKSLPSFVCFVVFMVCCGVTGTHRMSCMSHLGLLKSNSGNNVNI